MSEDLRIVFQVEPEPKPQPGVFIAESLGDVLEMAESLGWVDNFPDATHPDWRPTMADAIEEDAIEHIKKAGYRIVFPGLED